MPMLGVHKRIQRIGKSVMFFAMQKSTPLFTSADAGVRLDNSHQKMVKI